MREILFRGKCNEVGIYTGQWIEGFYAEDDGKPVIGQSTDKGIIGYFCEIGSIGQFTGLTDKNGRKIFEGDILKGKFKNYAVWFDDDEKAYVYGSSFQGGYRHSVASYLSGDFKRLEVIGNIYDNPNLLEVTK